MLFDVISAHSTKNVSRCPYLLEAADQFLSLFFVSCMSEELALYRLPWHCRWCSSKHAIEQLLSGSVLPETQIPPSASKLTTRVALAGRPKESRD